VAGLRASPPPFEPLLRRIEVVERYSVELSVLAGARPIAFFTAAGWFNWLVGDRCHAEGEACFACFSNWHVIFRNSYFARDTAGDSGKSVAKGSGVLTMSTED
jgi:hypothetical protein